MFNDDDAKFVDREEAKAASGRHPDGNMPLVEERFVEPGSAENDLGEKAA